MHKYVQGQNVQHEQKYKKAGSIMSVLSSLQYSWWFFGLNTEVLMLQVDEMKEHCH